MGTVMVAWTRAFTRFVETRGLPEEALFRGLPARREQLEDPSARIPAELDTALWHVAERQLGDPHLGVRFALSAEDSSSGVLSLLARTSDTIEHALRTAVAFHRLVKDDARASFVVQDGVGVLRWSPAPEQRAWHPTVEDALVGNIARLADRWSGGAGRPSSIAMQRPTPQGTDLRDELFSLRPRYGGACTELHFSADALRAPLQGDYAAFRPYLERVAAWSLDGLRDIDDLQARILAIFASGEMHLPDVARHAGMSSRTLQRRLRDQGSSYQALADLHRRRLATQLLADGTLTVLQVAHRCGFADTRSFRRATSRWFGPAKRQARA